MKCSFSVTCVKEAHTAHTLCMNQNGENFSPYPEAVREVGLVGTRNAKYGKNSITMKCVSRDEELVNDLIVINVGFASPEKGLIRGSVNLTCSEPVSYKVGQTYLVTITEGE